MNDRQKKRTRQVIRIVMVAVAVALLAFALVIPIANNTVAFGICKDLEALPLPADTQLMDCVSAAGRLTGNGNGMQYFGAVLLQSELPLEAIQQHYAAYQKGLYDCLVEEQITATVCPGGQALNGYESLDFSETIEGDGWYILYSWGDAPAAWRDWLNIDLRGH